MSTEPFKFGRDSRRVRWGPTLQVNLFRSVAAGIVFMTIGFIGSILDTQPGVQWSFLAFPLAMPLSYLMVLLPMGIVGAMLTNMSDGLAGTIAAFVVLCLSLMVTAGDPLIYFLHRSKPTWVPIDRYPFVAFRIILFVLRPEAG